LSISLLLLSLLYHSSLSYFVDHDITYRFITSLPGEVGLVEYICTHLLVIVFLAVDPDYVSEEFEYKTPAPESIPLKLVTYLEWYYSCRV
jgi:hypothetical protein